MDSFRRKFSGKYNNFSSQNPANPQIVVPPGTDPVATLQSDPSVIDTLNGTKMAQKDSMSSPDRKYWMPDEVATSCYECEAKFTTFRRRHHCRVCGQIFCSKCCNSYIPGENVGCQGNCYVEVYSVLNVVQSLLIFLLRLHRVSHFRVGSCLQILQ